jgi:hypothetical protein
MFAALRSPRQDALSSHSEAAIGLFLLAASMVMLLAIYILA